jgi:hypothetical protein
MTAAVTKAGPYFASGSISFSSLRNTFKEVTSGSISASELLRNTLLTNTSPIVPDATENASVSSSSDLKLSQFRNTIKYYYITQTGTDTNFGIDTQSWNSNLNKNIRKWMYINGTCGSNSTSTAAANLSQSTCNLTIDTSGSIYGAGGAGGTSSSISGSSGGAALLVLSGSFQNSNTTQSYNSISGVNSDLLSVDIHYRNNVAISKPVVIYIHGGAWALGDKANVDSKATFFTNLGYVFVSVNYRLSPAANLIKAYNLFVGDDGTTATASTRVKHSTHVNDCARAVTWVYNNISSYGGNPNQLILIGHSAGCHLVSLLATNQSYLTSAGLPAGKIIGCIANDSEGISGIYQQITNPVSDGDADPNTIKRWYMNAFGIYPDSTVTGTTNNITTDFATTTAAQASYTTASPISYIGASTPPFLVLRRGSSDRITRETQFVTALQSAGRPVTAVSYPDSTTYTHQEINQSIGATNDPPVGKSLPSGVSNVTTQIQNWITNLAPPPSPPLTGNNINVLLRSTAKIYGGGGGGEYGATGDSGTPGSCTDNTTTSGCGDAPSCPSGYTDLGTSGGSCCQTSCQWCGWGFCNCRPCTKNTQNRSCSKTYSVPGAPGGAGGNGAAGRGYNNFLGSLTGSAGSQGATGGCPTYGGSGNTGETGGDGGDWGNSGSNTNNTGNGGIAGRAVTGSNYSVTGTITALTVRGLYL